ncbi:GTPase HflX [bacterium]
MQKEKVILFGIKLHKDTQIDIFFSMAELARLVDTAGGEVIESFIQFRDEYSSKFLIGRGKLEEIKDFCEIYNIDTIISDDPLTSAQQRNIEEITNVKVLDRTRLILDIFAKRAKSKEGKLQVELAQLEYLLPRLTGRGIMLSQQKGGIGTKGPGERKLEIDRRKIREKITKFKKEIEHIQHYREIQRAKRKNLPLPMAALVGYTNAGKSTLMNKLTNADVFAEDKLFATLDATVRRYTLPNKQKILLADTVGFIQKLPHELIASFRATLEEINEADVIVHLVDMSLKNFERQINSVVDILKEINIGSIPIITVFNKCDSLEEKMKANIAKKYPDYCLISASTGEGIHVLNDKITNSLQKKMVFARLAVPYSETVVISRIYKTGTVYEKRYLDDYIELNILVDEKTYGQLKKYEITK